MDSLLDLRIIYTCHICGMRTKYKENLIRHQKNHNEKTFHCSLCYKSYSTSYQLTLHGKKHIPKSQEEFYKTNPFVCETCNDRFKSKNFLKIHIMEKHMGKKIFVCDICDYKTLLKYYLTQHSVIHTNERPYACTICPYKSRTKSNLRSHYITHTGMKKFECDICEYLCKRKCDLNKHHLVHHSKN